MNALGAVLPELPLVLEDLAELAIVDEDKARRLIGGMSQRLQRNLLETWFWQAHAGQVQPAGSWLVWMIMAGRGFGKTRAGAEWVSAQARRDGGARIALVGPTMDDVARVMVEGESGLLAVARSHETLAWHPTRGEVRFPSGAVAYAFSGGKADRLRGPQHHYAWCDEIAIWSQAEAAFDNLLMGLRLGRRPQALLTTTPRPVALLRRVCGMGEAVVTGGSTAANVHLADAFQQAMQDLYAGTRVGRQELEGVLPSDAEGSLWPRALLEARRVAAVRPDERAGLGRVVIGVDPPAGDKAGGDACGIVAVATRGADGLVIGDHSVQGRSPEGWARAVADAAELWGADRVVAEGNQGGAMVDSVLRAAEIDLPLVRRHASLAKAARAEPVAALFERGRAWLAGSFPALEDELAGFTAEGWQGPGRSPDRADACVWALTELMLRGRVAPGLRML